MIGRAVVMTGVVCDDRPQVRRTVTSLLTRCGFEVAGEADTFLALRAIVRATPPTVVVVTVPLVGVSSLAVVSMLHADAPTCAVVILSVFERLHLAALEAGAWALVPEDDPRVLQSVLLEIAAATYERDGPAAGTPGMAVSLPPRTSATVSGFPAAAGRLSTNPAS